MKVTKIKDDIELQHTSLNEYPDGTVFNGNQGAKFVSVSCATSCEKMLLCFKAYDGSNIFELYKFSDFNDVELTRVDEDYRIDISCSGIKKVNDEFYATH